MQLGVLQGRVGVPEGQCGLPSMYWGAIGRASVRRCCVGTGALAFGRPVLL